MESSIRAGGALRWGKHDGSAVGLIATHTNKAELIRAILQTNRRGENVVVTHVESVEPEGVEIARMMGARVLSDSVAGGRESGERTLPSAPEPDHVPLATEFVDPSTADVVERSAEQIGREKAVRGDETDDERSTVVVGIPAYNEANSIADVVETATEYGDTVLVVDDGSRDGTANAAGTAGATVIEHEYNKGYGTALKTLFGAAERQGADHLVVLDADNQHDSLDIPRLVAKQRETDADIVIGSRFVDGSTTAFPLYRRVALSIVNGLTNLSMGIVRPGSRVTDTQSGFRAYNRRAIEGLADDETIGSQMCASTDILFHACDRGYEIEEVGIPVRYDVENASSYDPISHGYGLVNYIVKTVQRSHPLISLGVPGLLGVLLSVTMGYQLVSGFLAAGTLSYSLLAASTLLLVGSLLASTAAVLLYTLQLSREL